jgi:hypothetical protein
VNHDSGVGANEKEPQNNSCTTHLTEGQLSKKIWFKDTPEDGARLAPKHVGVNFKKLNKICSVSKRYIVNSFKF